MIDVEPSGAPIPYNELSHSWPSIQGFSPTHSVERPCFAVRMCKCKWNQLKKFRSPIRKHMSKIMLHGHEDTLTIAYSQNYLMSKSGSPLKKWLMFLTAYWSLRDIMAPVFVASILSPKLSAHHIRIRFNPSGEAPRCTRTRLSKTCIFFICFHVFRCFPVVDNMVTIHRLFYRIFGLHIILHLYNL